MGWRQCIFGLLATAAACGDGSLGSGGTGGGSGTTGVGGTSNAGGTTGEGGVGGIGGTSGNGGGGAGGLPACPTTGPSRDVVEVLLVGSDGVPVAAAVTAAVTVDSIASCTAVTCPYPAMGAARRIVLTGAGQEQWTLYLRNSAMPDAMIEVGDTFDMTVDANVDYALFHTTNQTVVLGHGTDLVVFAASLQRFFTPPLPQLGAFGITLADLGVTCEYTDLCKVQRRAVGVAVGSNSVSLTGGETRTIGWLSFTNGDFTTYGSTACDGKANVTMAGFRMP